jgi:hypothetical protein
VVADHWDLDSLSKASSVTGECRLLMLASCHYQHPQPQLANWRLSYQVVPCSVLEIRLALIRAVLD